MSKTRSLADDMGLVRAIAPVLTMGVTAGFLAGCAIFQPHASVTMDDPYRNGPPADFRGAEALTTARAIVALRGSVYEREGSNTLTAIAGFNMSATPPKDFKTASTTKATLSQGHEKYLQQKIELDKAVEMCGVSPDHCSDQMIAFVDFIDSLEQYQKQHASADPEETRYKMALLINAFFNTFKYDPKEVEKDFRRTLVEAIDSWSYVCEEAAWLKYYMADRLGFPKQSFGFVYEVVVVDGKLHTEKVKGVKTEMGHVVFAYQPSADYSAEPWIGNIKGTSITAGKLTSVKMVELFSDLASLEGSTYQALGQAKTQFYPMGIVLGDGQILYASDLKFSHKPYAGTPRRLGAGDQKLLTASRFMNEPEFKAVIEELMTSTMAIRGKTPPWQAKSTPAPRR